MLVPKPLRAAVQPPRACDGSGRLAGGVWQCYQPVPPAQVLPPTWGALSGSSFPCLGELTSSPLSLLIVI